MPRSHRRAIACLIVLATTAAGVAAPAAPAAGKRTTAAQKRAAADTATRVSGTWTAYDRPPANGTITERDVKITMSDGTVLLADVTRPDTPGRHPVLLQQTPYNKLLVGGGSAYFAERGYAVVVADVRGTGGSAGTWRSFDDREQKDGFELTEWAAAQPWSDGNVGLFGASYMGLNQLLTAAQHPRGLKAIFPVVPMGDGYRDIVMSGGQVNSGFIPLWLGLVTVAGLVPPSNTLSGDPNDLVSAVTTLLDHVGGALDFQVGTVVNTLTGGDQAFDGPFWKTRSPIEVVDQIDVPAFVVGGLHDIFQRGEPLIYERLKQRVDARLLIGPWTHVGASGGEGLPTPEVPATLNQLQLRWFDAHLKGLAAAQVDRIPKVTQYAWGEEKYGTQPNWPDPRLAPQTLHLRGDQRLSADAPQAAEPSQTFTQQPLSGLCTQSTSQWTAGLGSAIPCTSDNRLDALAGATYTSEPFAKDLAIDGPILADLWVTTTRPEAVVTVRINDVAPDGTPKELTAGWLAGSFRATDTSRQRVVRGKLLQPWHPFTRESVLPVTPGEPTELPVEVFPTSAVIKAGHRLQVLVGPADFPHTTPPLPQLAGSLLGQVRVLTDPAHPSSVTIPKVGTKCATKGCGPLPVPKLVRG